MVRVYRCIGKDFWVPAALLGKRSRLLAKALQTGVANADIETRINLKLRQLAMALTNLMLPRQSLPTWVRDDFTETQLFWFGTAITAFYDEGI